MKGKELLQRLTSMKAAIVLFIALGIVAAFGTLIPQGFSDEMIVETYGAYMGALILVLQMDDLYHAWWFILLGIVLGVQILVCTIRRIGKVKNRQQIGSIALHLSIILVLIGACVSGLTGAREIVNVSIGETVELTEGSLAGTELTVDDFFIEYYDNDMASQYYCELTLLEDGKDSQSETISVNNPYSHNHIKIYQQSFGWESYVTYEKDGESEEHRLRENDYVSIGDYLGDEYFIRGIFISDYDEASSSMTSKSNAPNNPILALGIIANDNLYDLKMLKPGEKLYFNGATITFDNYQLYTGLNVKRDAGIGIIYAGFIFGILGLVIRYLPVKRKEESNGIH